MKRLRENVRGFRGRATPTPGSVLRQLRLDRGLSQHETARYYTEKGCSVARISQIEASARTTSVVECCYRAAVETAALFREHRRTGIAAN
jgi:hypothetical protein